MSTAATFPPDSVAAPAAPAVTTIFLPREHGSWFLVLEPLALGLLIAPSYAGAALAVAVVAAFFVRRPLKPALAASNSPRRRANREVVVMWSALALAGVFEVLVLGDWRALWALLPAALLGALFLKFDLEGEGREGAAEVAGSAAFAFLPAAIATLAGRSVALSLALAFLMLARSVPAVLLVRACLRARKNGGAIGSLPWVVSILAFAAIASLAALRLAPVVAPVVGGLLLGRAAWLLARQGAGWPARRIGQAEAVWGVLYIVILTASWPSLATIADLP